MLILRASLFGSLAMAFILAACSDDDSGNFFAKDETPDLGDDSSKGTKYIPPCADECNYGVLVDKRDGHSYRTVKIGNQVWMAEDLDYRTSEKMWYEGYGDCVENIYGDCVHHGLYYTWIEAIDSAGTYDKYGIKCGYNDECELPEPHQGICPEGWHLPSYDEFDELYYAMGEKYGAMQATGFPSWTNATDAYGFSALPAGYISAVDGELDGLGTNLGYWTSSITDGRVESWYVHSTSFGHTIDNRYLGYMVRCIQD